MKLGIPEEIQRIIGKETYSLDKVGMSGSEVRIYDNYVLKIEPQNEETDNAYAITKWLNHQLPVPTILAYCVKNGMAYTLMSRVGGKMLCAEEYLKEPEQLIKIAAQGLKCLWEIDVTECPYQSSRLMKRLEAADRWQDVAIAIRSLTANFEGRYSESKKIYDFNPQMFLDELGIDYDDEKYRYYLLLDELF